MIFVTLGSQKFQFNRLLIEIDRLIKDGKITEKVFAQTGYSDYEPINYDYKNFLDRDEFASIMSGCDTVITHGGTGAIISAVKNKKKVIVVPRLEKFGEHVDNHQLQIAEQFMKMKFVEAINEIGEIKNALEKIKQIEFNTYVSNTKNILDNIEMFIETI